MVGVGVVLVLLGLLFLVGSGGQVRRVVVAVVGLGLGGAAVGLGVRTFKRAEAVSPERIRAEILELARREDGEVTLDEIRAELGVRAAHADGVLDAMVAAGACSRHVSGGSHHFVFDDLLPRLLGRYCQYCDAEFKVAADIDSCPNCGGTLEKRVVSRSVAGGDYFKMDS